MIPRWRAYVLVGMVVGVVPSACSLLVSTDGLSGPSADAAVEQSSSEGGPDAPSNIDAGPDVRTDADASKGPFCPQHTGAAFCADFDDGNLMKGWLGNEIGFGGTITADSDAISPPFALRANTTMGASFARLWWQTTLPGSVHLEVDARFAVVPAGTYEVLKIEFPTTHEGDQPTALSAAIDIGSVGGAFGAMTEGWDATSTTYRQTYPASASPTEGRWAHFVVDAVLSQSSGSLHMTIDGKVSLDVTGVRTLSDGATGVMRIVVGPYVASAPEAAISAYDNVLVEVKP